MPRRIVPLLLLASASSFAAIPTCPAGLPIGSVKLTAGNGAAATPISLRAINVLQEGDVLSYSPVLRANEKRPGKVTLVLVPQAKNKKKDAPFLVLDPKPADKPAQWKVPFRTTLAVYVYGPNGLSTGKVKGFLDKDDELISQLADYAEKTAQTEALLQALSAAPDSSGTSDMMSALQGFAGQYGAGAGARIDRSAPTDQQTLAIMRALNPALSAYDPISPSGSQRFGQTTSLAASIAGMFFGSPVGLAAGGTAMAMNLKTLLFPNTEFRSTFAQSAGENDLTMCGKRDPAGGRMRLAYLWAVRIPDAAPPHIEIAAPNTVPLALSTSVAASVPDEEWKLVDRVRNWALVASNGKHVPVPIKSGPQHTLEVDLSKANIAPGTYQLAAAWDWDPLAVKGVLMVRPLSTFAHAHLDPPSQDRLLQHSGKQIVHLEGDDFEFVEKAAIARQGDKYDAPIDVPFSLPLGPRRGPQNRMELRIDAGPLDSGAYSLLLAQQGGRVAKVPLQVLPDPPKIAPLPIVVNAGESEQSITLRGEHLDRITAIDAGAAKIRLGEVLDGGAARPAVIDLPAGVQPGTSYDLKLTVSQNAQPLLVAAGLTVAGPRPRILDSKLALPSDLEISLRSGELPAGLFVSTMMHVENVGANTSMHLGCRKVDGPDVVLKVGEQNAALKLQAIASDTLFLSFDPGAWLAGCSLTATLQNPAEDGAVPFRLGKVIRVPRIESFRLTDQPAANGGYVGVLTGRDLEVIAKTGWDAAAGTPVAALPTPIAGQPQKQSLHIVVPWPSPSPHAPLYIWLRGDREGRATTVRY